MKKILFLFILPIFLYSNSYLASLDKVFVQDKFRYFYTLKGENALSLEKQIDENKNNVPDYVENIANQLSQSYNLFINDFGFISPLEQERFKNKAKFIDIHFINLKVNGAAGDTVVNGSLVMKLSINLIPKTLTPIHEFFHLIQYGYSMFNNRWSMEGQARWAEYSFRKGVGDYSKELPKNIEELEKLFESIYEAKDFWNNIAYLCSKNKNTFLSSKNYLYVDGSKFLEDNQLYGYEIIKDILENYAIYSKITEDFYSYEKFNWTEKEQKSYNNNRFIIQAIKKSLEKYDDKEIKDFIVLIDEYLKHLEIQNSKNDISNKLKEIKNIKIKSLDENYNLTYLNDLIQNKNISQYKIFPSKSIHYNIPKIVTKSIKYKDGFVYIGAYNTKEKIVPFGVYFGKIENDKLKSSEIKFNDNYKPFDILEKNNTLFLMFSDKTNIYNKIKIYSNLNELDKWNLEFQFESKFDITKFFYQDERFIFIDNKNSTFFELKEL